MYLTYYVHLIGVKKDKLIYKIYLLNYNSRKNTDIYAYQ